MTKKTASNQSSDKLLKIMEFMATNRLPMRLKDIAEGLDISQPTLLRFLRTLCEQGYVYQDSQSGFYAMTWKICRLGNSLESDLVLKSMSGPLLNKFANTYDIGVLIAVERDSTLVYLDLASAPHGSVDTMLRIGKDAPMHSTGSGKILLSAMAPAKLQQFLEHQPLVRLTPKTITDKNVLLKELDFIREYGYSLDNEECELGHRCVSVPLYDYTGKIVAAISAFDSTDRLTDEHISQVILPALKNLAKENSFRMGNR